jgi:hypothetical protein
LRSNVGNITSRDDDGVDNKKPLPLARGVVLVNFAILIGLYLLAEIALHIISSDSNPLAKTVFRIRDPVYHHTLKPKFDGIEIWGTKQGPHRFAGIPRPRQREMFL